MFKTLESKEVKVFSQTREEFKNATNHIERGFGILWEIVHIITEKEAVGKSFKRYAVYILSYRILRILRSAYWCMLCGYYDITMALLRMAIETHLLLYFLSEREKEAKEWFEGKEFRPAYIRKQVTISYDAIYRQMSEFVHPKIHTSLTWFFREKEEAEFWITEFNFEKTSQVVIPLMMVLGGTLSYVPTVFPNAWFKQNKESVAIEQAINRITRWNSKTKKITKKLLEKLRKEN